MNAISILVCVFGATLIIIGLIQDFGTDDVSWEIIFPGMLLFLLSIGVILGNDWSSIPVLTGSLIGPR